MNYLILIIVAIIGAGLGAYFALRLSSRSSLSLRTHSLESKTGQSTRRLSSSQLRQNGSLIAESLNYIRGRQSWKKAENKEKILEFLREHGKIQNNDVERLVGVSDATATRYLDELEKEGKVQQIGITGQSVYYRLQ